METGYARLSSLESSYVVLRRLWQWYDNGGISCGRALRAFLLEAAIGILRSAAVSGNYDESEVIKEALDNAKNPRPNTLFLFGWPRDITLILDLQFVVILLREMLAEFNKLENQEKNDPLRASYMWDRNMVNAALANISSEQPRRYKLKDIIAEAREREHLRIWREIEADGLSLY